MGTPYNLDTWEPRGVRQPLFQNHGFSCVTLGPQLSFSELHVPVKMGMATPPSSAPPTWLIQWEPGLRQVLNHP